MFTSERTFFLYFLSWRGKCCSQFPLVSSRFTLINSCAKFSEQKHLCTLVLMNLMQPMKWIPMATKCSRTLFFCFIANESTCSSLLNFSRLVSAGFWCELPINFGAYLCAWISFWPLKYDNLPTSASFLKSLTSHRSYDFRNNYLFFMNFLVAISLLREISESFSKSVLLFSGNCFNN